MRFAFGRGLLLKWFAARFGFYFFARGAGFHFGQ